MCATKYKNVVFIFFSLWCIGSSEMKSIEKHPLLTRYSIGNLNKTMPQFLEKMIPGIFSVNLFGVSAHLLNLFSRTVKGGFYDLGTAFVHIHPKHLALLLQFKGGLASNTAQVSNKTFLETFTKFYVPFGENDGQEIDYGGMEKLLNLASEYNRKQEPAGIFSVSKNLKLWISIPATENIAQVLHKVLDIFINTNSIATHTVTALLLNYRTLHFTTESVALIRDDISLAKRLIEKMVGNTLKTGIILEMHNCPNVFESSPLKMLNLNREDQLVFLFQLYNVRKEIDDEIPVLHCFNSAQFVPPKISMEVDIKIAISLENSTFTIMLPGYDWNNEDGILLPFYSAVANIAHLFVSVEIHEFSKNKNAEKFNQNKKIDESWLRRDTVFDPTHFGTSVYPPDRAEYFPAVISKLFKNFRKIIVEVEHFSSANQLNNFVQSMALYRATMVRKTINSGQVNQRDIPTQLLIVANINHENQAISRQSIKQAFDAAYLANREYPGVASVMLTFDTCIAYESETRKGEESFHLKDTKIGSFVVALGHFKKEIRDHTLENDYMPNVGVISEDCTDLGFVGFASVLRSFAGKVNEKEFRSDGILLRMPVYKSDILQYGASRTAAHIIHGFRNCDLALPVFQTISKKINVYIQLTGCLDIGVVQDNQVNIYEMAEISKFWELLNSWAVKENRTVFMGTSFEYPKVFSSHFYEHNGCVIRSSSCGWWMARSNDSVNNLNESIWQDRKSIALKLHEGSNLKERKNNFGSRSGKADNKSKRGTIMMAVFIPASVLIVVIVSVATFLILRYRAKHILSKKEMTNFVRGSPLLSAVNGEGGEAGSGKADSQPYNKTKYEIARSFFRIDTKRCLGSGEFATVMCGTIKRGNAWEKVAVKMIKKRTAEGSEHGYHLALKGLISEIKILSFVGEHKNVVKMEGACTAKMRSGKLFVFLEMCELGSLDKYLRAIQPLTVEGPIGIEMRSLTLSPETIADLRRWSIEIANGMEFLLSKRVVHADLATRNILLDSGKCAKVSDFGLSRRLYDYSEYLKKEADPLPWRWMAPESLRRMIFNEKSDVWAFGITLWEMYSLGDEPYPGLAWDVNFPSLLERGLRLNEPRHNQEDIYSLMRSCWEAAPAARPTFMELKGLLQDNTYVTVL